MKYKHPTQLPPYQPPPVMIVMASDGNLPPPPRFDRLRRPLRHIREQLKYLTGWGLHPKQEGATTVTRHSLPTNSDGVALSYLATGDSQAQRIIFIHGSPGRGDEFQPYLEECPIDQYRIAMDRTGYGESQPTKPLQTVAAQALAILPLLTPECIILGYSYGATVALRLASKYPDLVAGLLLIGCPIDPQLEYVHPFQRVAAKPLAARFLPRGLHTSNMELLSFRTDLQSLVPKLEQVAAKVTLMQGMRDTLVPSSNATLLAQLLTTPSSPRSILLPDGDHYLPWTHRDTIEQALGYLLQDCSGVSRG